MTGILSVPALDINGAGTSGRINLSAAQQTIYTGSLILNDKYIQLALLSQSFPDGYLTIQLEGSPASLCTNTDNYVSLGKATARYKDIYASSGTIQTSDERQKKDISPLYKIKDFFMSLNPVKYRYRDGTSGRIHHGLGAQEVEAAMVANGLTDMDFAGLIKSPVLNDDGDDTGEYIYGIRYTEFIPMLIKMVQDLQKEIDELKTK